MTVPFELPDTADLYDSVYSTVPYETGVPCRQVPCLTSGTIRSDVNVAFKGFTHWVDFDEGTFIYDATESANAWTQGVQAANPMIILMLAGVELRLSVLWVEDRYTNTPKAYVRAWCSRWVRAI